MADYLRTMFAKSQSQEMVDVFREIFDLLLPPVAAMHAAACRLQ